MAVNNHLQLVKFFLVIILGSICSCFAGRLKLAHQIQNLTHKQTCRHTHTGNHIERTAPSKTTDRLSSVSLLMSVKSNSGAADVRATVTWPSAEVAARLNPLPDCSFVFQSIDSRIFELGDCFVAQSSPGWAILSVITQGRHTEQGETDRQTDRQTDREWERLCVCVCVPYLSQWSVSQSPSYLTERRASYDVSIVKSVCLRAACSRQRMGRQCPGNHHHDNKNNSNC